MSKQYCDKCYKVKSYVGNNFYFEGRPPEMCSCDTDDNIVINEKNENFIPETKEKHES